MDDVIHLITSSLITQHHPTSHGQIHSRHPASNLRQAQEHQKTLFDDLLRVVHIRGHLGSHHQNELHGTTATHSSTGYTVCGVGRACQGGCVRLLRCTSVRVCMRVI